VRHKNISINQILNNKPKTFPMDFSTWNSVHDLTVPPPAETAVAVPSQPQFLSTSLFSMPWLYPSGTGF
jgi:hypothetical protein